MPFKLKCPSCNHVLTVPTQRAGSTLRCAVCNKKLRVPQLPPGSSREKKTKPGNARKKSRRDALIAAGTEADGPQTVEAEKKAKAAGPSSELSAPEKPSPSIDAATPKVEASPVTKTGTAAPPASDDVAEASQESDALGESAVAAPTAANEASRLGDVPPVGNHLPASKVPPTENESGSAEAAASTSGEDLPRPTGPAGSKSPPHRSSKDGLRAATEPELAATASPDPAALTADQAQQSSASVARPSPPRPPLEGKRDTQGVGGADAPRTASIPKPPPLPKSKRRRGKTEAASGTTSSVDKRPESPSGGNLPSKPKPAPPALRTKLQGQARPTGTRSQPATRDEEAAPPTPGIEPPAATDDTNVEEAAVDEQSPVVGYEHEATKRWPVYYLGMAMIAASLFGVVPAVFEVIDTVQAIEPSHVATWAWCLFLMCGIQLAYAIYILQLPDWGTVWIASLVTLISAAAYAMLLSFAILAREESELIQMLGLGDKRYGHQVTGWCLIMLGISVLLAYFGGRISVRWHQAYVLVTELHAEP